ncbi:MAG: hypothetical protein ACLR4Z_17730 [Butyricicoccaceae bacterium]
MNLGAAVLPAIPKDTTDRNRTSPFAFTGNKFEFRSLGSSVNIACANVMLNTAVAEELRQFADELEGAEDFDAALMALIKREIKTHKRIIFNGNGYDESWVVEAEKRGLLNFKSAADAFPHYVDQKNLDLFARHNVYTAEEIHSRMETQLEEYNKILHIEAMTMERHGTRGDHSGVHRVRGRAGRHHQQQEGCRRIRRHGGRPSEQGFRADRGAVRKEYGA